MREGRGQEREQEQQAGTGVDKKGMEEARGGERKAHGVAEEERGAGKDGSG